ncbi:MAG: hypothetical protein P4M09_28755 [Devosia sp.]|nr:hypothetical protein [Devosia sp.]
MRRALLAGFAVLSLLYATPAPAQNLNDIDKAEKALDSAWAQGPLRFRQAFFVSTPPAGFGIYEARPDAPFKKGEKLIVYAEPVGYGWKDNGDGTYNLGFDVDLAVKGADGTELAKQPNFAHLSLTSHARNHEFMLVITLDLTGADPGKYVVEYTAHDIASPKSAVISLPFSVAG